MQIVIEQIKIFSPQDAEVIKALAAKLGNHYTPLSDTDIQDMIAASTISLFVARNPETKQIIGMITQSIYRIPYTKKSYLDDLIVDENYRGYGIGGELLKKTIEHAKEAGVSYIELTSNPKRVTSHKLYEKFGFVKRETNVYRLTHE